MSPLEGFGLITPATVCGMAAENGSASANFRVQEQGTVCGNVAEEPVYSWESAFSGVGKR